MSRMCECGCGEHGYYAALWGCVGAMICDACRLLADRDEQLTTAADEVSLDNAKLLAATHSEYDDELIAGCHDELVVSTTALRTAVLRWMEEQKAAHFAKNAAR